MRREQTNPNQREYTVKTQFHKLAISLPAKDFQKLKTKETGEDKPFRSVKLASSTELYFNGEKESMDQ